jgi:CO/xanthine dehydrogenase FAD-binding subunit
MKPPPFEYAAPDSMEAALALLQQHGEDAKLLAGGQSLIPAMNFRLLAPTALVDLNRITDLSYIRPSESGGVLIGAMTRQGQVERSALVADRVPLLYETVPFIAHPQIRNRGTVGGSLVHADPAAELPVICTVMDARFRARGPQGDRWIEAGDFFQFLFTTALEADEILVEIELPALLSGCQAGVS